VVERNFLQQIDIGLMPLANNPWTRGKCAYKALQYMAAGIPVVADDVGISARVIGQEQGGSDRSAPRRLGRAHRDTCRGSTTSRGLGGSGRRRIEEGYSIDRWAPELAAVVRGEPVAALHQDAPGDPSAGGG
jgi:glycosyltransferase involved in cell wall biosynthesis